MKKENNTTINNDLNKKLEEIQVTEAPSIYGENSEDDVADRKQKTFLTEKNIRDYIHYQKKNNIHSFDDVQMLVYHHPKNDGYFATVKQTIESLITTELDNKDSQGELVRKVLFTKLKNAAHIGCFVIFIDKSINPPEVSLFCPGADRSVALDVDLPEADLTRYSLGIQKDKKSCGITALKMAKHLTSHWYQDNKENLKNIVEADSKIREYACFHNLPFDIYPEKLLTYQQGNANWIASNYPQVALENANKGYIQLRAVEAKDSTGDKTENKNENSTDPNANTNTNKKSQKVEFKYQNVKLQESKIRRLYENYYQQEKKQLDKKDQNYRSQKQKIIEEIKKKFNKDQEDIHNSSINEEDEKFLTYINA